MAETVKSVAEMFDDNPVMDRTAIYDRLWKLSGELKAKFDGRFEMQRDPSSEDLEEYGDPDGVRGQLRSFTGPELDWMVHSWLGNPAQSFTNIHVTGWLAPHIDVPHIGFAFGTLPQLWFLVEYIPRSDLSVDVDALDKYYEPMNEKWLGVREDPRFDYFVSRSLYVRQVMSETSFPYTVRKETEDAIETIEKLSHEALDQWLGWIDEAEEVPVERRAALAERDLAVRRNTAVRDPANALVARFLGEDLTDRLVGQLWGEQRVLPRPHEA